MPNCDLLSVIHVGWPDKVQDLPTDLRQYWSIRDELVIKSGIICKGQRVLIPTKLRSDMLNQLHERHQGIEKTRQLARESLYWPNINKDIECLCKSCEICQELQPVNCREPLSAHTTPARPWQDLSSDLFEVNNSQYLLLIDRYSHYPIICDVGQATSAAVTKVIKYHCGLFGRPDRILTDNGTQFSGQCFQEFVKNWDIMHMTSSPRYPQSNGLAERAVKHIKSIIKKALRSKQDVDRVLLNIRATPISAQLPSPGELLCGRAPATLLPRRSEPGPEDQRQALENKREKMIRHHNSTARKYDLPPLYVGQQVRILDKVAKTWCPGTVQSRCDEPRSYIVETPNGNKLRRNRAMLREILPRHIDISPNNSTTVPERLEVEPKEPQPTTLHQGEHANGQDKITYTTRSGRIITPPKRISGLKLLMNKYSNNIIL